MHKIFRISYVIARTAHVYSKQFVGVCVCVCLVYAYIEVDAISIYLFTYFCVSFFFHGNFSFFLIFLLSTLALFTYFNEIFLFVSLSCTRIRINNTSCSKKFNNTQTCACLPLERHIYTHIIYIEWSSHKELNESNLYI